MNKNNLMRAVLTISAVILVSATSAFADRPATEELRETVPLQDRQAVQAQTIPAATGCNVRASAGVPVWFFTDEDNEAAAGAYFDYWCADVPLNYRLGVELRHLDIKQGDAAAFAEGPGQPAEMTYVRIPMAVEYYQAIDEDMTWYIGLGPDIINGANDISDTAVGMHIGTRVHYAFTENWGASLEGGYMWAELEDNGSDFDLDGWYVTPALAYTF